MQGIHTRPRFDHTAHWALEAGDEHISSPVREATVILHDIEVLWGFPKDSAPVIMQDRKQRLAEKIDLMAELLE